MLPGTGRHGSDAAGGSEIPVVVTEARGGAQSRRDAFLPSAPHSPKLRNPAATSPIRAPTPQIDHGTSFAFVKYEVCFVSRQERELTPPKENRGDRYVYQRHLRQASPQEPRSCRCGL